MTEPNFFQAFILFWSVLLAFAGACTAIGWAITEFWDLRHVSREDKARIRAALKRGTE